MSFWTHVSAIFRVSLGEKGRENIENIVGKTIPSLYRYEKEHSKSYSELENLMKTKEYQDFYNSWKERWIEYKKNKNDFIPTGSEGSLNVEVIEHGGDPYTEIVVYGDLRDYDNPQPIEEWFKKTCDRCYSVHQATCNVSTDGVGSFNLNYNGEVSKHNSIIAKSVYYEYKFDES